MIIVMLDNVTDAATAANCQIICTQAVEQSIIEKLRKLSDQ